MDFCFGLVAIFLILDVISIRFTDGFSKNSNQIQLSSGIINNPFLRKSPVNVRTPNGNPFLQSVATNDNKIGNPFLSKSIASQTSNIASSYNNNPFPNSANNPFLNPIITNTRVGIESSTSPRPSTQSPHTYSPPPYYQTSSSVDTYIPPKIHPPVHSRFPSWEELIPIKNSGLGRTLSERKCDEYVGEIAGTISIASLTGSSDVLRMNNVCENANRLVVGGTEAEEGEFPHMVALGRLSSEFNLMCGGTLISHTWVLSAAHCTYGPDGGPTHARLGFHRLTDQKGLTVAIKDAIRHPEYNPPAMYADVALMQLMNDVTFNLSIRPACLYQPYDTVPKKAWVSGWGGTEFGGDASNHLRKAQLDLIDNLPCTIRHNSSTEVPYGITTSMICAGYPQGNWSRDACQGDSGGPLQIVHSKSECLFQVIGITSFGLGCAMIDIPGVYTRVSHYLPWIEKIVWSQGQ